MHKHIEAFLLQQISVMQDEGGIVEELQLPAEPQHAAPPPSQPASTSGAHLRAGLNLCRRLKCLAHGDCSHQGRFESWAPLLCMLCFALLDSFSAQAITYSLPLQAIQKRTSSTVICRSTIGGGPSGTCRGHMHCQMWHVAGSLARTLGEAPATFAPSVTFSTLSRQQSCSMAHSEAPASCIASKIEEPTSLHAHSCP